MSQPSPRNRLSACTSPYLRQHADNPVHWQCWDADALALARERDVPILLSIGYASCHWCHVMAHESFEDAQTAAAMNRAFVSIKVDREERPDLDRVYQTAHQILTRQPGGWPLTAFLDPHSCVPFFSGTYIPRTPRYGMPSFMELLGRIETVWTERREELAQQGAKVQEIFDSLNATAAGTPDDEPEREPQPGRRTGPVAVPDIGSMTRASADERARGAGSKARPALRAPDRTLIDAARAQLGAAFDATDGGFGTAPKFPMPSMIERLLRHWAASADGDRRDGEALEMAMHTLTRMARGGIFDHLGGGFCRYSTDAAWLVPHFEKMLFDNGALLGVYADAMAISPDPLLESVVRDTAGWLVREMQHPAGGFFAALDADSDGGEGRFHVWHREQVRGLLDDDEYQLIGTLYGIDKPANFEGVWILHRRDAFRSVVERLGLEPARATALFDSARRKLFEARETRPRPGRDEKVLVAWNGLAIRGLARAATVLDEPLWGAAATRAVDFIRRHMQVDGRLHASWTEGSGTGHLGVGAFLEDHALLLEGLLELFMLRWRDVDLRFAVQLADALLAHFRDAQDGGFFQTAHDAEVLIHRPKPGMDEALPAGNAIAARALGRLGHLLGRSDYLDAAAEVIAWAQPMIARAPQAHCAMLDALEDLLTAPELVIIRGAEATAWARDARAGYRPRRSVFALPTEIEPAPGERAPLLPGFLPEQLPDALPKGADAATVAWLCTSGRCSLPITSRAGLDSELGGSKVVTLRPKGS